MFAWQILFAFPGLLLCLHYWVMLTVINNKYSTLRLDIEGCWNKFAPSFWNSFVSYDLCLLFIVFCNVTSQNSYIPLETYIKGSIKYCKVATSSFSWKKKNYVFQINFPCISMSKFDRMYIQWYTRTGEYISTLMASTTFRML